MTYKEYDETCARIEKEILKLDPEKEYLKLLILADKLKSLDVIYKREKEM